MSGPTGIDMSILSATGPTGMIPAGLTVFPPTEPTGETGTVNPIYVFFPSAATGPVEAPHIATIEELMASYGAIVNKEIDDKKTVLVLLNENRESLRVPLFQWAAAGFPASYIVQSVTIEPPSICSDGVSRNYVEYLNYCLGKDLNDVLDDIRSKMVGIGLTVSFEGNTLRLHVAKNL